MAHLSFFALHPNVLKILDETDDEMMIMRNIRNLFRQKSVIQFGAFLTAFSNLRL